MNKPGMHEVVAARFRKMGAPMRVTPESLNVKPELVGMVLASPKKRAAAIGIDLLLIAALSGLDGPWGLAAMLGFLAYIRKGWSPRWRRRTLLIWPALLLFVGLGALQDWRETTAARPSAPASQAKPASAASSAAASAPGASEPVADDEEREDPRPVRFSTRLFDKLKVADHTLGLGVGWAMLYFTLLPYYWNGQTVGKRLLRLRVVELTGKPMTLLHCLGRYGGYAAGMATGMFGFAQVFWDVNRQAIQDKIAHTVVLDLGQASVPS